MGVTILVTLALAALAVWLSTRPAASSQPPTVMPNPTLPPVEQMRQRHTHRSDILLSSQAAQELIADSSITALASPQTGSSVGWYIENDEGPPTKINYYFNQTQPRWGDLESSWCLVWFASKMSYLYFALYTLPENDGYDQETWFRSRKVYDTLSVDDLPTEAPILLYIGVDPPVHPLLNHYKIHGDSSDSDRLAEPPIVQNTEKIAFISVQTASNQAANMNAFTVIELGYMTRGHQYSYQLLAT